MKKRAWQIQKKTGQTESVAKVPVKAILDARGRYAFATIGDDEFVRLDVATAAWLIGYEFTILLDGVFDIGMVGTGTHIREFADQHVGELAALVMRMGALIESLGCRATDDPNFQRDKSIAEQVECAFLEAQKGNYEPFKTCVGIADERRREKLNLLGGIRTRGRAREQATQWLLEHADHIRRRYNDSHHKRQEWADTLSELAMLLDHEPDETSWKNKAVEMVQLAQTGYNARQKFVDNLRQARKRHMG